MMNRRIIAIVLLAGVILSAGAAAPTSQPLAPRPQYVAVLPFAQDFADPAGADESYGQRVAIAIGAKWATVAGYEVVDQLSVAEAMEKLKIAPSAETPEAALHRLAETLGVQYIVYGSASGPGPSKRLIVKEMDARTGIPILNKTYKLDYWTDLRFVLEDVVSAATGATFTHPSETLAILDPASTAAWENGPNLVNNPRFQDGADGRLTHWEALIQDKRYGPPWTDKPIAPIQEDVTKMVLWSPAPDDAKAKVLQFAMPESIAGLNGLACFGDWIYAQPGARYRMAVTYRSDGPTMLNFIKGYALIDAGDGLGLRRREVYRRQFPKLGDTGGQWKTAVVDFVPSVLPPGRSGRVPYELKWIRVELYGYWPKGRMYIKDVMLKLVEPGAATRPASNPVTPVPASRPASK